MESTLAHNYDSLRAEAGDYLGWGRDPDNWTEAKEDYVDARLEGMCSKVYWPQPLPGERKQHSWSWMRPVLDLTTVAEVSQYPMPDTFEGVIGSIKYTTLMHRRPIEHISYEKLSEFAQNTATGFPEYFTLLSRDHVPGIGTRWLLEFWPTPSDAYALRLRFNMTPRPITPTNPYPPGGASMRNLYETALRAELEEKRKDGGNGFWQNKFIGELTTQIRKDRQRGPEIYAYVTDPASLPRLVRSDRHCETNVTWP